ncbi:MAG: bifunctional pyr operon transcriptional regulator/uracil phosphoribosyltransferase PyrR [Catalinimonas sp.]
MQKRLILDQDRLSITLGRLCRQLTETHGDFSRSVVLGLQPRGVPLAERLVQRLHEMSGLRVRSGKLDPTFYRDDFRRRDQPLLPNATQIPFLIENQRVVLVDDVLHTGRTVRAALDAMLAFGRPAQVELLALIDRKHGRHLPIEARYVGLHVQTLQHQRVYVEWHNAEHPLDQVWLTD